MNPLLMIAFGSASILLTLAGSRLGLEQQLRGLSDRDKLVWVNQFAWWRIGCTIVPSLVLMAAVGFSLLMPVGTGWAMVLASTALIVFFLIWNYRLIQQLADWRVEKKFVSGLQWLAIACQVGLMVGLILLAFAMAGSRL